MTTTKAPLLCAVIIATGAGAIVWMLRHNRSDTPPPRTSSPAQEVRSIAEGMVRRVATYPDSLTFPADPVNDVADLGEGRYEITGVVEGTGREGRPNQQVYVIRVRRMDLGRYRPEYAKIGSEVIPIQIEDVPVLGSFDAPKIPLPAE